MAESLGFTGLGAPSLPGFPFSPLPGQCVNSQPWLRALTHCVATLMRGRPGCRRCRARATGLSPVGPPWAGVARAVPWSCECGARGRFGKVGAGAGCCVFPVSPCPPRVSCAVCGGPGTPFHAVCAFRGLGPVALLVFPACPLCVCALALSRHPRPPPPSRVGVARAPRAVPVLGAGRAVPVGPCPSACPASVPCSVWLGWGGTARSCLPLPGLGLRAPRGLGAGVGTRHQPHRARSCELALRAGLARCRGGTRAPGGGASCLGAGRPGSGALPPPTTRPFWRAAGAHYPLAMRAGGAGVGTRHQPHSARSCELALRAVGAA